MTKEPIPQPNPLERKIPDDQLGFELELLDRYSKDFPNDSALMSEALNDLKQFSGMNIPKYKVAPEDLEATQAAGLSDEMGFLVSDGPPDFSFLTLQIPKTHTAEEIGQMTQHEKTVAATENGGVTVVGDLPVQTQKLIDGLYDLTGALIVRDDLDSIRLLKGEYMGEQIFFEEQRANYGDIRTFSLRLVSPDLGDHILKEPTRAQIAEFMQTSGLDAFQAQRLINPGDVNKDNYRSIAETLREANDIANGASEALVDEVISKVHEDSQLDKYSPAKRARLRSAAKRLGSLISPRSQKK